MSQDLRVALVTSLNDRLVGPLRRSLDEVEKNLKDVERELVKVTQGSQAAGAALAGMQGPAQAAKQAAELTRHTRNAVNLAERLKAVWSAAGSMMNGVVKGMAAYQAARYVVAPSMQQARDYDLRLAHLSNVAYSDMPASARAGKRNELNDSIKTAVMSGGGTRDSALQALSTMMASGVVSQDQANKLLPLIQKYSSAGDVDSTLMADIATKMLQAGFKLEDVPSMFDEALAAGQLGGFELKDMAKWLPKLIPAAKKSGLGGREGFRRVLAAAQMSITTAGSPDEAGNNLVDTLLQMTSQASQMHGKMLVRHGGKENIDVAGSLAAARGKGMDTLTAFVNLVEQVGQSYPAYVALQKRIGTMPADQMVNGRKVMSEEKRQAFEDQASVLMGAGMGLLVHNRQELMPLLGLMNGRARDREIQAALGGATGQYGQSNFDLISGTAAFRVQQGENAKLFAQTGGLGGANEALAKLADVTSDLYQRYPGYAEAVEAAKLALGGLAAAAGAAGLAGLLMGGKAGLAGRLAGVGAGLLGMAGPALALGAAGAAGYGAGTLAYRGMENTGAADALGGGVAKLLALLGNDEAKAAVAAREKYEAQVANERAALAAQTKALSDLAQRPIKLYINEREIAASVDSVLDFKARRN